MLYFIGKYEDVPGGYPRLVKRCQGNVTEETAELLTRHYNDDLGHVSDGEGGFTRKPGERFYFMYDEEAQ